MCWEREGESENQPSENLYSKCANTAHAGLKTCGNGIANITGLPRIIGMRCVRTQLTTSPGCLPRYASILTGAPAHPYRRAEGTGNGASRTGEFKGLPIMGCVLVYVCACVWHAAFVCRSASIPSLFWWWLSTLPHLCNSHVLLYTSTYDVDVGLDANTQSGLWPFDSVQSFGRTLLLKCDVLWFFSPSAMSLSLLREIISSI